MRFRYAFSAAFMVLTTSGCFFHGGYPNRYYGPGPSVVPQSPSSGFPGGPFYQPGGTYSAPLNGGPTYVPGNPPANGGPTPIYTPTNPGTSPGTNPTYEPPTGTNGNSPGFNPETPSGGKTVPLPGDEPGFERGTQRPQLTPTSATTPSTTEPEDETPFHQTESRRLPEPSYDPAENLVEEEDQFHPPSVRQTAGSDGELSEVQFANTLARPTEKLYGHHPEFRWVQGTVDFDAATKTWFVMYDNHPQAADPLGGDLTLADHPLLARLKPGNAVRIEGALDETEGDARGKPVFRMTRFKKL